MNKYYALFIVFLLIISCSNNDENNPADPNHTATGFMRAKINNTSWFADKIQAYRQSNSLYIIGTEDNASTPIFSSSEIRFQIINLTQPGTYGIGEDEPGYRYFVKANYILYSATGITNLTYTAYYLNYSTMNISRINADNFAADFIFRAFVDSTTSVDVTDGVIDISF